MAVRAEQRKQELVQGVAALCRERVGDSRAAALQRFIQQFYAHVPPEDVLARSPEDLYGAALSLWDFAHERSPGSAKLRVLNPRQAEHGWQSGRTIVEIVNDDMPFLVDSVTAAINSLDQTVHLVIHPVVRVQRDAAGRLVDLLPADPKDGDGAEGALRESLMHIEISELSDPSKLKAMAATLDAVLGDVRNAVTDWQAMRTTLAVVLLEIATRRPPLPAKDVDEAVDFLKWLAEDNFTFLGYREYDYGAAEGPLKIKAKAGLGILRDPEYSVFDGLRQFATLPAEIQQSLRRPRLLMITKSNKRATVHRPAHMDAIGVKTFGANGEVTGERLFLGLFTSVAYSRSVRSIPLLQQKVQRVMQRAGFAPASHDGKALLHILDTYPRDELFQITDDELFEIAMGILNLQERQRIALFVRRDAFGRFLS
jgi:glutamate dehydrogenase